MMMHKMIERRCLDEGKREYLCVQCDRCIAIYEHDGSLEIIAPGDQSVTHYGGAFSIDAEVEA